MASPLYRPQSLDMHVTQFERDCTTGGHSIERLFAVVRHRLPENCAIRRVQCPTPQQSWAWFVRGLWKARTAKSEINHIVGDVHYVALALPGRRTILTVHDLKRLSELAGLRRLLYRLLYFSFPLRRCEFVTTISTHVAEELSLEFSFVAEKLQVVPDCVLPEYRQTPYVFNAVCPRILQVGTAPHKNAPRVARALKGIRCTLEIIGRPENTLEEALIAGKVDYEIHWDLSDAEMLLAYQRSDLVVFASLAEGFGMPIIEAQAVGRPVITSNLAPMIDVAGEESCLVDPYDVESIHSAILRVIGDSAYREALVGRGTKNVDRFSADSVAAQYAALYRRVAYTGKRLP